MFWSFFRLTLPLRNGVMCKQTQLLANYHLDWPRNPPELKINPPCLSSDNKLESVSISGLVQELLLNYLLYLSTFF